MKKWYCSLILLGTVQILLAQDATKNGFTSEKLFTGGSISLGLSANTFFMGLHPVIGYSLSDWMDFGTVFNYTHSSFTDPFYGTKYHYRAYGAGLFARLYPIKFLFAQVQAEQNFMRFKENSVGAFEKTNVSAGSVLIGGGFTIGRKSGTDTRPFLFVAFLTEVTKNENSPYLNSSGKAFPIMRVGLHIPLFQKKTNTKSTTALSSGKLAN